MVNQASGKDESQYRLECQELASKLKEKDKEMEGITSHVELLFQKEKKQENETNKEITRRQTGSISSFI